MERRSPAGAGGGALERADQLRAGGAQLGEVVAGEAVEQAAAARGDVNRDAPAVAAAGHALSQAAAFEAVDQFDGGVVVEEEALGEQADVRGRSGGSSGQDQQHLVLLGSQARGPCGAAAEIQEFADAKAEFLHGAERVAGGHVLWGHAAILS